MISQCAVAGGGQAHKNRIKEHMLSSLVCLGRHTVTGHLATAGRQFQDWTGAYRLYSQDRLDSTLLFEPILRSLVQHVQAEHPVVVAVDDTRLKKSGRKIPGVQYTRDPLGPPFNVNFILAQRFLQMSIAWSCDERQVRMIPVDFLHAPRPQRPPKNASQEQLQQYRDASRQAALPHVAAQRLALLRKQLDADPSVHPRPMVAVVDGGYTNRTFLSSLPERSTVIGRIRADAKIYALPNQQKPKGRHAVYGPQLPTPEQLRQDSDTPWQTVDAYACGKQHHFRIKTIAPIRWRPTGNRHDLRLVVIAPLSYRLRKDSKLLYRKPAYLICTDTQLPLEKLLQYYLWRWDIETNFRDEKTLLGVGQAQVRHPQSVHTAPALSVAAYASLLTAACSLSELHQLNNQLPPAKWSHKNPQRLSTQNLIDRLRNDLWSDAIVSSHLQTNTTSYTKSPKILPDLYSALFYGASKT